VRIPSLIPAATAPSPLTTAFHSDELMDKNESQQKAEKALAKNLVSFPKKDMSRNTSDDAHSTKQDLYKDSMRAR